MARWTEKAALRRTRQRVEKIRNLLSQIHDDWDGEASERSRERINDDLDLFLEDIEQGVK